MSNSRPMKKVDAHRERMLLLRYACERIARSVYKDGWRQRARVMEKAALFASVASQEGIVQVGTVMDAAIAREAP